MGYFAARSAPFGVVPTEVVTAAFYNFAPERVAKALPAAWDVASPPDAMRVRRDSAVAALRRYDVTDDEAGAAAELAEKAARSAPLDGRPLFAANVAMDWPDQPVARLWHAVTLLREQRGDGHVAVLATLGVSGRESNVLHAAAGRVPQEMIMRSRDYDVTTTRGSGLTIAWCWPAACYSTATAHSPTQAETSSSGSRTPPIGWQWRRPTGWTTTKSRGCSGR